jgi:Flp pilus assembly protein TadD
MLADPRCLACHPKEVAGYARSAMAHSLSEGAALPSGAFEHTYSGTRFSIRSDTSGIIQAFERRGESGSERVAYIVGSGKHAFGFLIQIRGHLFQSPISYYSNARLWDMAPGYEEISNPDFSRPVTPECLLCHSGEPEPIEDTLNTYKPTPFREQEISCDRCHGPAEPHLRNPGPGSIVNPARLNGAARDSVCEQCHLRGEVRIPNPGQTIGDFRPGQTIEDVYTIYVANRAENGEIKVISHSEQLALSGCARHSGGKLWCGTCHNPHESSPATAEFFRSRCLSCHGATLESAHAAPDRDCVGCHMPRLPARDGGHTAFTDHRIRRRPGDPVQSARIGLAAWREPDPAFRERNLALALVAAGLLHQSLADVSRGYSMLRSVEKQFPNDRDVLTSLGSVELRLRQPGEALRRFLMALSLRPNCASYEVNAAAALIQLRNDSEAIRHLNRALELDPLLQPAVTMLSALYRERGQLAQAGQVTADYRRVMSIVERSK